jgi:ppGpp synthetase/RelA/SpoT-type nucleotidyltranferase
MVPADLRRLFDGMSDVLPVVASKVKDIVLAYCEERGFPYFGRLKTLASLAEKIESGRFSSWSRIDDLFGCAIIIPTLSHENATLEYLRGEFIESELKQRGQVQQDPEVFRFGATRFIGHLRPSPLDDAGLSKVRFEVQIRTAFEHAWSVAVHDLAYKADRIDWKLERLAAQMKASVEQLDALVSAYEQAAGTLVEHPWPALADQNLILEFFRTAVTQGRLSSDHAPEAWGRFAKNVHAMVQKATLYGRLGQLDRGQRFLYILQQCDEEIRERGCPRTISLFHLGQSSSAQPAQARISRRVLPLNHPRSRDTVSAHVIGHTPIPF